MKQATPSNQFCKKKISTKIIWCFLFAIFACENKNFKKRDVPNENVDNGTINANANHVKISTVRNGEHAYRENEHSPNLSALETDIASMVDETGLSTSVLKPAIEFQNTFEKFSERIEALYPDTISRIWVDPAPKVKGHIQFVEDVPSGAIHAIAKKRLYDFIELTGYGHISAKEHKLRSEETANALVDLGYDNAVTFFDVVNNVIQIEVRLEEKDKSSALFEIVKAVQTRLDKLALNGRAAKVVLEDYNIVQIEGKGPLIELLGSTNN